jgi:hypothetical protein
MERPPEKKQPPPSEPAPEVAPRDDVSVSASPTRCPYCHEGIQIDAEAWVACSGCLGRHHRDCWDEGGKCAGCGETEALSRAGAPAVGPTQPRDALVSDPGDNAPRRIVLERSLGREVSDEVLTDMVAAAQRALASTTPPVTLGRSLTWSSETPRQVQLRVHREGGHTTLRLEEDLTPYSRQLRALTIGVTVSVVVGLMTAARAAGLNSFAFFIFLGVFALSLLTRRVYVSTLRRRQAQLEDLAAELLRIGGG